jgi:myo-inositol-1(or 4)-monophosphatase
VTLPFAVSDLAGVAAAAAGLARSGAAGPLAIAEKLDGSPVTAVDRAVDEFLAGALKALLPGSAWLSEESDDDRSRLKAPFVWIVDPIDGTQQLVRGIPEVAISIGLAHRGAVVAAAIVNPMTGESGVWVEGGAPVFAGLTSRPAPPSLESAEAIVSRSESEDGELARMSGVAGAMRPVGSVAYKLLRVAAGSDAVTFSIRAKLEWDVCAGAGLLAAAGGVYLRLDGLPLVFNQPNVRIPSGATAGPEHLAAPLRTRINARL